MLDIKIHFLSRLKCTFGRRVVVDILLFLFLNLHPCLHVPSSLHLQRLALSDSLSGSTVSIARHVSGVDALVVLNSVFLDAFPHLLDAEVELVLRLLLLVDEVVGVMR